MKRVKAYTILSVILLISMSVAPIGYTLSNSHQSVKNEIHSSTTSQTSSNEIIWETTGNPEYLDPHINYESFGSWIFDNVYETLYTYSWTTDDSNPDVPLLATDLSISLDQLEYTFTLRQGITFHDGTPFNASCVKYNLERVLAIFDDWGPAWMIAENILGGLVVEDAVYTHGQGSTEHVNAYNTWLTQNAIEVLSTYVVKINLAAPYVPFLAVLSYSVGAMISPSYIEAHGGVTIGSQNTWMTTHTCGTGPYMVTDWVVDSNIDLELNTNYWRESQATIQFPDAGSISDITIIINENEQDRIDNILEGDSDGCYWSKERASEIYNGAIGSSGDGTIKSSNSSLKVWADELTYSTSNLGFNMGTTIFQGTDTTYNPFTLKDFREAISYAFDYDTYIDTILYGFGIPGEGPIPVGLWGHDDSLPLYDYDITNAVTSWNAAMAAGLDTILEGLGGELILYYNEGNNERVQMLLLVKSGIEAILADGGATQPTTPLTVSIYSLEWATYLSLLYARTLPIFFLGWSPDYADPDDFIIPYCHSTMGTYAIRTNLTGSDGWDEVTVDGWIADAATEDSISARLAIYENIQTEIVEHAAYLWTVQNTNFHVERAEMNGYVYNPMRQAYFYHYHKTVTTTYTTLPDTTTATTTTLMGFVGPSMMTILLIAGGGGIALILIIGGVFSAKRRRGSGSAGFDYTGTPPDDGFATAEHVTPSIIDPEPGVVVVEEPPPFTGTGEVQALRGGEIVGGAFEYKIKVKNDTAYVINNVTVTVVAYPQDCMNLEGETMKQLSRIEPGGFRSPQFKFTPSKDCVEGQVLSTVSYVDHQNKIRTAEVEPFVIRSVCDLLTPLKSSMDDFEEILQNMQCTSEEHQLEWNPKILFKKAETLLPSKNFYIVDKKTDTMAGEFIGTIRGFAEGKYTNKKVAVRIRISGLVDGNQSRVIIEGLGDDIAMLPTTIDELTKGIEAWICTNCGSALNPEEVIQIKSRAAVQCRFCNRTLTIDLFRK